MELLRAEQTSSFWVVWESSNDQDHADGNVECRCTAASGEVIGNDMNAICLSASRASHVVAHVVIHSQVASQGTGIFIMRIWQCINYLHLRLHFVVTMYVQCQL
jgi:hypothetical protein